jgi:parallel beta-helix repeat protein
MKDTVLRMGSFHAAGWLATLLIAAAIPARAQVIPATRTINWAPGVTVGLQGGTIPVRTNIIDVTQAPYNADSTGNTDASGAINSAIAAAPLGSVIYFPDGTYLLNYSVGFTKSYITLRGHTNSVIVGVGSRSFLIKAGNDRQPQAATVYPITSGFTKGSTSLTLSSAPTTFKAGDQISVTESCLNLGSDSFPVMNVHQYDGSLLQQLVATSVSGNTVSLSAPVLFDFTNGPIVADCGIYSTTGVGFENLIITCTNMATGQAGNYSFVIQMSMCHDSWITNCSIQWANNYGIYLTSSSHVIIAHNQIQHALSAGSNHSGLISDTSGECLIEDNIISDGLEPGIEFNSGFSGNAIFGNYFVNNLIDILCHNTHPLMNLWEENICSGYFEVDGYFGSASHQTVFRNSFQSGFLPLMLKRWVSYCNVVGNVLGSPGGNYGVFSPTSNGMSKGAIIQFGYPNIGNNSYTGNTGPTGWNYPGLIYNDTSGRPVPNGICTFTNDQVNVTNLIGNFANIPGPNIGNWTLVFQDGNNTNIYYPTNGGPVYQTAAGTSTNLLINRPFTVRAGWTAFMSGQNAYQQYQTTIGNTHILTGNYDYFNNAVKWDANGPQTLPASLLYTSGAPAYWGTNRWPAIDPVNSPNISSIPAQLRYSGNILTAPIGFPPGLHIVH